MIVLLLLLLQHLLLLLLLVLEVVLVLLVVLRLSLQVPAPARRALTLPRRPTTRIPEISTKFLHCLQLLVLVRSSPSSSAVALCRGRGVLWRGR